jgi:hypothetical protein
MTHDDTCGDSSLDHGGTESSGVEVDEALVHDRRAFSQMRTETHSICIGNAHPRWHDVIDHPGELVDSVDRHVHALTPCAQPYLIDPLNGHRSQRCPCNIGQQSEDAIEIDGAWLHKSRREQVKAQIGVRSVGGCGLQVIDDGPDRLNAHIAQAVAVCSTIHTLHVRWVWSQGRSRVPHIEQDIVGICGQANARRGTLNGDGSTHKGYRSDVPEIGNPPAHFHALCLDAVDPGALGRFWTSVLDLPLEVLEHGDTATTLEGQRVWINRVPERKSVKHRVHFDVRLGEESVNTLESLGARLLRDRTEATPWQVWGDPEGGEFCVMRANDDPAHGRATGLFEMVVDCADPLAQATWWQGVIGGTLHSAESGEWHWLESVPGMPLDYLVFVPVPEPKTAKNRIHWDIAANTDQLLDMGASLVQAAGVVSWDVLGDPEGNEFCVFTPKAQGES